MGAVGTLVDVRVGFVIKSEGAKAGAEVAHGIVTDVEGVGKIAKVALTSISLAGKVAAALSDGWYAFCNALKTCLQVLDVADLLVRIAEWAKGTVQGAWKIASRVCLTVLRVFNVIEFLEKVKLIDLSSVIDAISKVPVLGYIVFIPVQILGLFSFSFSLVHNTLEFKERESKINLLGIRLQYEMLKQSIMNPKLGVVITAVDLDTKLKAIEAAFLAEKARLGLTLAKAQEALKEIEFDTKELHELRDNVSKGKGNELTLKAQNRLTNNRVAHLQADLNNVRLEKDKSIVSMSSDALKVAVVIIGFVGAFFGGMVIAIAALGVVTAAMGLFKVIYEKVIKLYMQRAEPVAITYDNKTLAKV